VARAFQTFASSDPAVHFMEQDPNNLPGFLLFLEFPQNSLGIPNFQIGQIALDINSTNGSGGILQEFIGEPVDIDRIMFLVPEGEGHTLFFPVNEQEFLRDL
jgi:hypothetical protein